MKNVKIEDAAYNILKSTSKKFGIKIYKLASDAIIQICAEWEKANDKTPKTREKILMEKNLS